MLFMSGLSKGYEASFVSVQLRLWSFSLKKGKCFHIFFRKDYSFLFYATILIGFAGFNFS